jgi:hypothetical protein
MSATEKDIRLFLFGLPQQKTWLVPALLTHWAESQKTSGADSADCGRILIESQKVVRSDQLPVFSEWEKELLRKKVMGSMFAAE